MSWMSIGKKPLRLFFLTAMLACMLAGLAGCGTGKYEAVELDETYMEKSDTRQAQEPGTAAETDRKAGEDVQTETRATLTMTIQSEEPLGNAPGEPAREDGEEETEAEGTGRLQIEYEEVDETVIVTADVLNVRAESSVDARIYTQLQTGDTLHRTGYHEEWSRVLYNGEAAYVASEMVEVLEEPVQTEEAGVDEESGAKAGGEAEAAVPREAAVALEDSLNRYVVAIDAGHQAKANAEKEPIGPSSETMKAKMPEGSVGTVTGVKEYELTLTVAEKLKERLAASGYQVVMVRTSHDVNLSNAERARIANESDADIFIRLHANSMDNSSVYGALTMCMTAQNPYNANLHSQSYTLSKKIIDEICSRTGTKNRGVQEVDNNGAINWSEIPVSVVEMGFLSNPDEDRWLQDDDYQDKIVEGITAAVDSYFGEGN